MAQYRRATLDSVLQFVASGLAALALVPGFAPVARGPAGGEIYRGVYPSAAAPQPLRAGYLYLPPGYTTTKRYPVIYLLHGLPGSPSEYIFSLELAKQADGLIASHAVRPFIAVIPAAGVDHWNGEWAGPWEDYLVDAVIPWAERHLAVDSSQASTTIAGLSAGGYGAVNIAFHHPTLFGRIESWGGYFTPIPDGPLADAGSATLVLNDPVLVLPSIAAQLRAAGVRLLLSSGPAHGKYAKPQQTIDFARALWQLKVRAKLDLATSKSGMWRDQFNAGLRWAFAIRPSGQPRPPTR